MTESPQPQETRRQRHPERKATPARKKPRKPRQPKQSPETDIMQEIVAALIVGYGPGGKTAIASAFNLSPSNLNKRMASRRGAFDSATALAYISLKAWKAENFTTEPIRTARVGRFEIAVQRTPAGDIPTWRTIE